MGDLNNVSIIMLSLAPPLNITLAKHPTSSMDELHLSKLIVSVNQTCIIVNCF